MKNRILILGILTSIIQVFFCGILYDLILTLFQKYYQTEFRGDLSWGISLHYHGWFYVAIAFIINLIIAINNFRPWPVILCLLLILSFDYSLLQLFDYRPYKVSLLLLLSNGVFILTFLVDRYLEKRKKDPTLS